MKKILVSVTLFVAVLALASQAMAVAAPVFSPKIADDYGGAIEFSGTNATVKVEFRLVPGVTYASLPKFGDTYTTTPALADWATTKEQKFDLILMTLKLPITLANFKEIPVTCEVIDAGTAGTIGEKIRCTQKTPTAIAALTQSQVLALAGYIYVFLWDGYDDYAVNQVFSFPLSLASLVSKGITGTATTVDDDLDAIADDVDICPGTVAAATVDASGDYMGCSAEQKLCYADGTLDCDADGVLNASDECKEEVGVAENNGCPAAAPTPDATAGDGGGCSTIAPVGTPNISGLLMLVLAALPMIARRKR